MNEKEMKELAEHLVRKVEIRKSQMRKCPFCGCDVGITICDEEGNDKPLDYLDDPYSGIAFTLNHENGGCIICDLNDFSPIYYDENDDFDKALDELVSDWNGGEAEAVSESSHTEAADMMEREYTRAKKYEYALSITHGDTEEVIDIHKDTEEKANSLKLGNYNEVVVRREVGEWEEVRHER